MLSPNKQPLCPSGSWMKWGKGSQAGGVHAEEGRRCFTGQTRPAVAPFFKQDPCQQSGRQGNGPSRHTSPGRPRIATVLDTDGNSRAGTCRENRPKTGRLSAMCMALRFRIAGAELPFPVLPRIRGNCWTFGTLGPMVGRVASPPHTPESEHV
jgi:hypothetical protein